MKILGIETATIVCSVAVVVDNRDQYERNLDSPQVHSQKLLTLIDEVLKLSGETIEALDGIAISIGPGSFTGLRIGLSAAKGLAYASGKPLLAVSTLEALALGASHLRAPDQELILAVLESRREEFYAALYRVTSDRLEERAAPAAYHYNELIGICPSFEDILVTGSGAEKFMEYYRNERSIELNLSVLTETERRCNASQVAMIGGELLARDSIADLASLEPMYIKEFYTISPPSQITGN